MVEDVRCLHLDFWDYRIFMNGAAPAFPQSSKSSHPQHQGADIFGRSGAPRLPPSMANCGVILPSLQGEKG
jgi:hypothetical protein